MMERVSSPVRKFAAIGLLVAAVFAVVNFVVEPVARRVAHVDSEIAAKRGVLGHLGALVRAADEARAAGKHSESLLSQAVFLSGESETVQLSNLQSELLGIAEQEGIRPQSSRTVGASQREGLDVIGLQMALQIDMENLQRFIHRIEARRPVLIIDGLAITRAHSPSAENDAAERLLQIDMRVLTLVPSANRGLQ